MRGVGDVPIGYSRKVPPQIMSLRELLQLCCWYKAASMPSSSTAVQRIDLPRGAAQNRSAACFLGSTVRTVSAVPQRRTGQALALELGGLHASESKQELVKSWGLCSIVSNTYPLICRASHYALGSTLVETKNGRLPPRLLQVYCRVRHIVKQILYKRRLLIGRLQLSL